MAIPPLPGGAPAQSSLKPPDTASAPAAAPSPPPAAAPAARPAKVVPPQIDVPPFSYAAAVDAARGNPAKSADTLYQLAHDVKSGLIPTGADRVALTDRLLQDLTPAQVDAIRAAYVLKYKADPELDILGHNTTGELRQLYDGVLTRNLDIAKPDLSHLTSLTPGELARETAERVADQSGRTVTGSGLSPGVQQAMADAVARPEFRAKAQALSQLLAKPPPLTQADRALYFSTVPTVGLWDHSRRSQAGDDRLDAPERTLLKEEWAKVSSVPFDDAMKQLEARMPPAPPPNQPPEKSVAIVVSSAGAQLQELFDEVKPLLEKGYAVQLFTPDGRPVAFQRDSLLVFDHQFPTLGEQIFDPKFPKGDMGYGAPVRLDPREKGNAALLAQALATTTSAANFDPKKFGAVYLAGGLGFNEDVAVATVQNGQTVLTANPNVESMMHQVEDADLPIIGLCHGGTLLAAVKGKDGFPMSKGVETSSLPVASELFAIASGRAGYPFRYTGDQGQYPGIVDTHALLAQSGAKVDAFRDIARLAGLRVPPFGDISRSSRTDEGQTESITLGEGPQAGPWLAAETIKILQERAAAPR